MLNSTYLSKIRISETAAITDYLALYVFFFQILNLLINFKSNVSINIILLVILKYKLL